MGVVPVEHVVLLDFPAGGVHIDPVGDVADLEAHDVPRARLQVQRQQRDGRVVGHGDWPAAQVDRVVVHERQQVAFDALLARQFVQFAVGRAVLGRRVGEQRHQHDRPAGHPPTPPRVAPLQARPAEGAGAGQDAQDGRRRERVAGVDRQADRGERGEHDDRDDAHTRPEERAAAQPHVSGVDARRGLTSAHHDYSCLVREACRARPRSPGCRGELRSRKPGAPPMFAC
jgi:hypothetical protein